MPDRFIPVARTGELLPGHMKWVSVAGERVLLANVAGAFHAIADVCGHKRAPLSRGRLDGHIVECPLHFARYDLRTGKLVDGPISADVAVFEVRVDGDTVSIKAAE
ncbi:MAG TPA: non-heme iron oxygenase ferredoxin subunit [Stellaceae bacterium]|nr:non-heme iron oxygenase ferredoxin subunit [Stellaceae bacterium]